jgi:hypothetical protein
VLEPQLGVRAALNDAEHGLAGAPRRRQRSAQRVVRSNGGAEPRRAARPPGGTHVELHRDVGSEQPCTRIGLFGRREQSGASVEVRRELDAVSRTRACARPRRERMKAARVVADRRREAD